MAIDISIDDLKPFAPEITQARADIMISGALARASLVAPCLVDDDFLYVDAARAILIRAIIRWEDAGAGNITQVTRGPFSESRQPGKELYWPSEIAELQNLCRASSDGTGGTALPQYVMPQSPLANASYRALWGYEL